MKITDVQQLIMEYEQHSLSKENTQDYADADGGLDPRSHQSQLFAYSQNRDSILSEKNLLISSCIMVGTMVTARRIVQDRPPRLHGRVTLMRFRSGGGDIMSYG